MSNIYPARSSSTRIEDLYVYSFEDGELKSREMQPTDEHEETFVSLANGQQHTFVEGSDFIPRDVLMQIRFKELLVVDGPETPIYSLGRAVLRRYV